MPILRLYRHLLREASLLTLPQSRSYFRQFIVARFHHYRNKHLEISSARSAQAVAQWQIGLERRGRRLLSVLTRANLGHVRPFERVLQLTFARKGPRRRAIMARLMYPDRSSSRGSSGSTSPRTITCREKGSGGRLHWQPPPFIRALLSSQEKQQQHFTWSNYKIRPQGPALPKQTIWGKPMPVRRARNAWVHWYARNVDRLYVPLPEAEYQAINAVARGWVRVRGPPPRPRAGVPVFAAGDRDQQPPTPADSLLRDFQSKNPPVHLLRLQSQNESGSGTGRRSAITERFVQRRMAQLLKHVPRLRQPDQPGQPAIFEWRDGIDTGRFSLHETSTQQNKLLFG